MYLTIKKRELLKETLKTIDIIKIKKYFLSLSIFIDTADKIFLVTFGFLSRLIWSADDEHLIPGCPFLQVLCLRSNMYRNSPDVLLTHGLIVIVTFLSP